MPDERLQVRARLQRAGARPFLLDVDLALPVGITVLAGPSGAGKSTLLAIIAGLEHATGRVALGDEVWLDGRSALPAHRRRVGYVPQSLALLPHLDVLRNVTFGIDRALPRGERESRALVMLERLHVVHLALRAPRTLSGGEAQRVALARALAMRPRAALFDEPLSALDHDLRAQLIAELAVLARELAVPVAYVTHDRREARALSERVIWLERGTVVRDGALDDAWPPDEDFAPRLREVRS